MRVSTGAGAASAPLTLNDVTGTSQNACQGQPVVLTLAGCLMSRLGGGEGLPLPR